MSEEQNDFFGATADVLQGALGAALDDPELRPDRWPRAMVELIDVFTAGAQRAGLADSPAAAQRIARWAVLTLAEYGGGRQLYLPKGEGLRLALRDAQIWQEFDGRNTAALAIKHRLTTVRVYQILAEQRALRRGRTQPELPLEGGQDAH